jgi:hypothetical protein
MSHTCDLWALFLRKIRFPLFLCIAQLSIALSSPSFLHCGCCIVLSSWYQSEPAPTCAPWWLVTVA